jgi:hypothetical protein
MTVVTLKKDDLAATLKNAALDAGVVAGVAVCCYGLWLAWHPLGFIVGGLSVAAGSFVMAYDVSAIRRRK